MRKDNFKNIDGYIKVFPKENQKTLQKIRLAIKKAAPKSEEAISYQIPTFKYNGNLVHFASFSKHIGFYPGSKAIKHFKKELSKYETSKGTIRFPLNKPIPFPLITKITKWRVKIVDSKKSN